MQIIGACVVEWWSFLRLKGFLLGPMRSQSRWSESSFSAKRYQERIISGGGQSSLHSRQPSIDPFKLQLLLPWAPKPPPWLLVPDDNFDDFNDDQNDFDDDQNNLDNNQNDFDNDTSQARAGALLHERHLGWEEKSIGGDQRLCIPWQECFQVNLFSFPSYFTMFFHFLFIHIKIAISTFPFFDCLRTILGMWWTTWATISTCSKRRTLY